MNGTAIPWRIFFYRNLRPQIRSDQICAARKQNIPGLIHPSITFSSKSVERGWWNINRRGFIDRKRKGVGVREEENIFFLALHAQSRTLASLADVFEKNEKKNKITSVYRLDCYFNQHYQHRTNQKLCSCSNAVFQNRGVCGQAFPSLPPSPSFLVFSLSSHFSRRTRAETLSTLACENIRFSSLFAAGDTQALFWGTKDDCVRSIFSHVKITWYFLKFSRVKISCFRVKAHLVFHWYLCNKCYSIYIKTNGRFEIREDPRPPTLCF